MGDMHPYVENPTLQKYQIVYKYKIVLTMVIPLMMLISIILLMINNRIDYNLETINTLGDLIRVNTEHININKEQQDNIKVEIKDIKARIDQVLNK